MPQVKEITVFKFSELEGQAKERARQWLIEGVGSYEWWDSVYEMWIEDLKEKGIETDEKQMFFSGFSSQGDGACFTGTLDLPVFMRAHPALIARYLPIYAEVVSEDGEASAKLERNGSRYYHENTVSLHWGMPELEVPKGLFSDWAGDVQSICHNLMQEFYVDLEREYESLTSDEALQETAEANEYLFDERGRIV